MMAKLPYTLWPSWPTVVLAASTYSSVRPSSTSNGTPASVSFCRVFRGTSGQHSAWMLEAEEQFAAGPGGWLVGGLQRAQIRTQHGPKYESARRAGQALKTARHGTAVPVLGEASEERRVKM